MVNGFISQTRTQLPVFRLAPGPAPVPINVEPEHVMSFGRSVYMGKGGEAAETAALEPNLTPRRMLYVPRARNYPAFDVVYDDGAMTVIFAVSITEPSNAEKKEQILAAFKEGMSTIEYKCFASFGESSNFFFR